MTVLLRAGARSGARPTPLTLVLAALALLAAVALLTGCTTGPTGSDDDGDGDAAGAAAVERTGTFPRTVAHAYGETQIDEAPVRVATVSWVNADVSLALGVAPVGVPTTDYGGNASGSTDWFDAEIERIGAEPPATYSETDGINVEEIAALEPDLILGVYSGMTPEDYERLSSIAPTVAMPEGDVAYGTPWQDTTRVIGEALGLEERADELVADVEGQIAATAEEHPALEGTSFVYGTLDPAAAEKIYAYTGVDNRPRFLEALGMTQSPAVARAAEGSPDEFAITWSPERADELDSDVVVTAGSSPDQAEAITRDPLLGQIPAVREGRLVVQTDEQQVLSISAASPLSIPWALDTVVPPIADAAAR